VIYDQITWFDRFMEKDKLPIKILPKTLKVVGYRYLFNKRFYIVEYEKSG